MFLLFVTFERNETDKKKLKTYFKNVSENSTLYPFSVRDWEAPFCLKRSKSWYPIVYTIMTILLPCSDFV
jgi:hypothetical protein